MEIYDVDLLYDPPSAFGKVCFPVYKFPRGGAIVAQLLVVGPHMRSPLGLSSDPGSNPCLGSFPFCRQSDVMVDRSMHSARRKGEE